MKVVGPCWMCPVCSNWYNYKSSANLCLKKCLDEEDDEE